MDWDDDDGDGLGGLLDGWVWRDVSSCLAFLFLLFSYSGLYCVRTVLYRMGWNNERS